MTARDKFKERLSDYPKRRVEDVCYLFDDIESRGIHHWRIFDELVFFAISNSTEHTFEENLDSIRTIMIELEGYFPEARNEHYRPGYGDHLFQESAFRSYNILKLFFEGTGMGGGQLPERSVEHAAIESAIDVYLESGIHSDDFERFAISISAFPRALGYALFLAQGERVVMNTDLSEISWPSAHHFSVDIKGYESNSEFLNYLGRSWKARSLELGGSLIAAALAFITFGGIERLLTSTLAALLSGLIASVIIGLPRILLLLASLWETRLEKKEALSLFNHLYQFCSITERTIRGIHQASAASERDFVRIAIRRLKDLERHNLYFPAGLETLLLHRLKRLEKEGA